MHRALRLALATASLTLIIAGAAALGAAVRLAQLVDRRAP